MSRRPPEDRGAVVTLHKQGLTPAEICRKTGFDYHFVTRWIAKHNESGSLDDAKRAGRPRKLSKSVELTVERTTPQRKRLLYSFDRASLDLPNSPQTVWYGINEVVKRDESSSSQS